MHIRHVYHIFPNATSPQTVNFPSSGNLIVLSHSASSTSDPLSGVTTSPSNTFTLHNVSANLSAQIESTDSGATTASTLTMTITWTGTPNGASFLAYDISGASATPYDSTAGNVGNNGTMAAATTTTQSRVSTDTTVTVNTNSIANNDYLMWSGAANTEVVQVTSGGGTGTLTISRGMKGTTAGSHASGTSLIEQNLPNTPSISPNTTNGLCMFTAGLATGPPSSASPGVLDSMYYNGETDGGGNDSADYYSHYYNPSAGSVSNTMTIQNGAALTGYNYIGVCYKHS
jgi:hypothetical protein